MNILILGGTGAMGSYLVKLLSEANHMVVVTSRKHHIDDINVQYVQGDAHSIEFLDALLEKNKGCDAIIDFMSYKTNEFSERVQYLLEATKQYIFLSSARVYADEEGAITENSPRILDICKDKEYLATDEYALSKARQENLLVQSGYNNYTIIRPYITFGENRLQLGVFEKEAWLYRVLNKRSIVFSEDIASKRTTMTFGYDVARAIMAVVGKKEAYGQVFHVTSEKSYTWGEILDVYLETLEAHTGRRPNVIMTEKSHRAEGAWKHQVIYDRYYDRTFCNAKISKYIDVSSFAEPLDALRQCIIAFLNQPKFGEVSMKDQASMDRIAKEHLCFFELKNKKEYMTYLRMRYLRKE